MIESEFDRKVLPPRKSTLSDEELEQMRREFAYPEMRPCKFDVSVEAWLMRINTWGKLTFFHRHPENRIKEYVTQAQFLKRSTEPIYLNLVGKWEIEQLDFYKLRIFRNYLAVDNKRYREEYIVTCIPKKRSHNKGIFGFLSKLFS